MSEICVIIPMYGNAEYTRACIDACQQEAGVPHVILVVDDGSQEPFKHDSAYVLRLEENSGFTNAVNQGILWCADRYKYIHLLNNDTVPKKDFLKVLYDHMEANPSVGIASSSRIYCEEDGTFKMIENWGIDLIRGYQQCSQTPLPGDSYDCLWIPLCSALIRHSLIREIGLLDRRMRNHCSDNDYCIRAKMMGWKVELLPKSTVIHYHELTTKKNPKTNIQHDQQVMLEKIANFQYADLLTKVPLDYESKSYGKLTFDVYKKD